MIELISISRIIIDYFWEYKFLSALHVIASLLIAIFIILKNRKLKIKISDTDKAIAYFIALSLISFAANSSEAASIDLSKFLGYLSLYIAGRLFYQTHKSLKFIGWFSLFSLMLLTVMATTGNGYLEWGAVRTFTGGYFFKTDLAISCLISLIFIFSTLNNRIALTAGLALAGYLVFKSNTRIALPLVLIIPVFIKAALHGKLGLLNLKTSLIGLSATAVGIAIFAIIDFHSFGMLGFDFTDPLSAANTQGRSVIWSAILHAYYNAPLVSQIFGSGLSADTEATRLFSTSMQLEGVRAHNSHLYLLLCMGIAGSISFYWLLYSLIKKALFLLRQEKGELRIIPTISCALFIMFFWLSITTEIIIRPQLMILLFFFSGLHVQSYLSLKKTTRAKMREYSHNS